MHFLALIRSSAVVVFAVNILFSIRFIVSPGAFADHAAPRARGAGDG